MPQIKPFDLQPKVEPELESILDKAANLAARSQLPGRADMNEVRKTFNDQGASLEDVAFTLRQVMTNGSNDSAKVSAARLALEIHGILQEMDDKPTEQIIINITNQFGNDNKSLVNLVVP